MEVVFLHPLGVGGDGGALDSHAVLLGGVGGVHSHLVTGLIPVLEAQVVVFGLQVHEGEEQLVLDHLPQDAGHLVAVHLHQGGRHGNFGHG